MWGFSKTKNGKCHQMSLSRVHLFYFPSPPKKSIKRISKSHHMFPLNGLCSTFPRYGRYPALLQAAIVRSGAVSPLVERLHGDMMKAYFQMQGLGTGDESPNRGSLNLFLEKGLKGRKRIGKKSGRPIEALKNHLVGFFLRQSFCGPSMEDDEYMISIINVS